MSNIVLKYIHVYGENLHDKRTDNLLECMEMDKRRFSLIFGGNAEWHIWHLVATNLVIPSYFKFIVVLDIGTAVMSSTCESIVHGKVNTPIFRSNYIDNIFLNFRYFIRDESSLRYWCIFILWSCFDCTIIIFLTCVVTLDVGYFCDKSTVLGDCTVYRIVKSLYTRVHRLVYGMRRVQVRTLLIYLDMRTRSIWTHYTSWFSLSDG